MVKALTSLRVRELQICATRLLPRESSRLIGPAPSATLPNKQSPILRVRALDIVRPHVTLPTAVMQHEAARLYWVELGCEKGWYSPFLAGFQPFSQAR
jgi:hypothetical protein